MYQYAQSYSKTTNPNKKTLTIQITMKETKNMSTLESLQSLIILRSLI